MEKQALDVKVQEKPWRWQEGEYTVTRTTRWSAPGCHLGCAVLYYTKNGKLVKVEGDKDSPVNQGRLCPRCLNLPEGQNHPDRVTYPMKRVGERGSGKFERITWDEAYDTIVKKTREYQKEFGKESVMGVIGTGRNTWGVVPYITAAAFESPNFAGGFMSGDSCYLPRAAIQGTAMGDFTIVDCAEQFEARYKDPRWKRPEVIVIWGNNPLYSNGDGFFGHWVVDCMKLGSKLVVVDPRLTWLAARADHFLQLRPGSDTALALAMCNVIIEEGLYDKDFVSKWVYGFDEFKERVAQYPPEKAAELTWLTADQIREAARFYANARPAAIQWGLAVDQSPSGMMTAHGIIGLRALTGNIDVPGGDIIIRGAFDSELGNCSAMWGFFDLPDEVRAKRLGCDKYPLYNMGFCATANADSCIETLETGKPYPIKMLWLQSTNPISCAGGDAKRIHAAMLKVPFIVNVDPILTPTSAAVADILLPVAMSPERDSLRAWFTPLRAISRCVEPMGEARTDEQILLDIGHRLNPDKFPWKDVDELLTWSIRRAGLTYKELQNKHYLFPEFDYKKYEKGLLRPDKEPGFNTPTGLIELYSTAFRDFNTGLDPLPYFLEPYESPNSTPEVYKDYPFVLTTGARNPMFFHSEQRQETRNREFAPCAVCEIHPDAAAKYGIQDGDWVWLESRIGKVRQKAKLTLGIDPRVIHAEHGWWYPEKPAAGPSYMGTFDSNINVLATMCTNGPSGYGSNYKCMLCRVSKAEQGVEGLTL